jgi:hypothetical protein
MRIAQRVTASINRRDPSQAVAGGGNWAADTGEAADVTGAVVRLSPAAREALALSEDQGQARAKRGRLALVSSAPPTLEAFAPPSIDVAFEPVRPKLVSVPHPDSATADEAPSAEPADPWSLMEALEADRRANHGDIGHAHMGPGCGFCRRAAAVYRF